MPMKEVLRAPHAGVRFEGHATEEPLHFPALDAAEIVPGHIGRKRGDDWNQQRCDDTHLAGADQSARCDSEGNSVDREPHLFGEDNPEENGGTVVNDKLDCGRHEVFSPLKGTNGLLPTGSHSRLSQLNERAKLADHVFRGEFDPIPVPS